MARIKSLRAWEILDSRGFPTVEAEALLADGAVGRAAVPSGASTGEHEALERRDADKARFGGKGVLKAVAAVQGEIAALLAGKEAGDQAALDAAMIACDGTPHKGRLGANALLAASLAVSRAAAASAGLPLYRYLRKAFGIPAGGWSLPVPMLNVINGGKHADSGLDVQEFMVVPTGAPTFREALRAGAEVYQVLKSLLARRGLAVSVGDEGGFAPRIQGHDAALDILVSAIRDAGHAGRVDLALDAAASEFHRDGAYQFEGKAFSSEAMGRVYEGWVGRLPMISIEDPLDEDDWSGWKALTSSLGGRVRIVGDDLFVTNRSRLARGIREGAANAILIKLNQIGTLTETVRAVQDAGRAGFKAIISHRSGETEDSYIADLSVALGAGAIKTGAPCRSERLCKYNQLLRIEAELKEPGYAGKAAFSGAASSAGVPSRNKGGGRFPLGKKMPVKGS